MKARRFFLFASFLFLMVAASCVFLSTRSSQDTVRIPVHCANGKIGFINRGGRMVIAPVWQTTTPFGADDRALVSITKQPSIIESLFFRRKPRPSGFPETRHYRIDRQGNLTAADPKLFDPFHIELEPILAAEMTLMEKGAQFQWLFKDGSPAFEGSWQQAKDFQKEDPASVLEDRRWGFINRKGEKIIPCRWDDTLGFDGRGNACVMIGRKWGSIDREGRIVIPPRFKSLTGFDEGGFSAAELPSGWGFVDRLGKIAIPFRYHKLEPYDRFGMAKIQLSVDFVNPRTGWINRSGQSIIEPRYDAQNPEWSPNFTNHPLLPVIESGNAGLIDRNGRTVVAIASGELKPVVDPVAPNDFWITTLPYRSLDPSHGITRPPFQPACYDSAGTLIWNGDTQTKAFSYMMFAVVSALISAFLFIGGRRIAV